MICCRVGEVDGLHRQALALSRGCGGAAAGRGGGRAAAAPPPGAARRLVIEPAAAKPWRREKRGRSQQAMPSSRR